MELRLLFAFILMGVVLFLTPYFYKTVTPPVKKYPLATTSQPVLRHGMPRPRRQHPPKRFRLPPPTASGVPRVAATDEQLYAIDTDVFRISFSNRGAVAKSWLLKKYKAHGGNPLELVNTAAKVERPFALYFPGAKPSTI